MEILKSCPLCGYDQFNLFVEANDYLVSKKNFFIVKCDNCGFLFTNPRPYSADLGGYYQSDEYISHTDSKQSLFDRIYHVVRKRMLRKKISFINSQFPVRAKSLKLLDYGCGTGEFLSYANQRGFATFGIEPDDDARNLAISKGLLVKPGINSDFIPGNNQFDVITLWHVLEHIPDPVRIIEELDRLLAKDGLIVVAVPEYQSYDALFYKNNWAAWDVPRHLNHFDKDTLLRLLSGRGFELIKKYPLVFDSFYVSLLSEKVQTPGLFKLFRAFIVGLISNILALFRFSPYSSQVYFFRKK